MIFMIKDIENNYFLSLIKCEIFLSTKLIDSWKREN